MAMEKQIELVLNERQALAISDAINLLSAVVVKDSNMIEVTVSLAMNSYRNGHYNRDEMLYLNTAVMKIADTFGTIGRPE